MMTMRVKNKEKFFIPHHWCKSSYTEPHWCQLLEHRTAPSDVTSVVHNLHQWCAITIESLEHASLPPSSPHYFSAALSPKSRLASTHEVFSPLLPLAYEDATAGQSDYHTCRHGLSLLTSVSKIGMMFLSTFLPPRQRR